MIVGIISAITFFVPGLLNVFLSEVKPTFHTVLITKGKWKNEY